MDPLVDAGKPAASEVNPDHKAASPGVNWTPILWFAVLLLISYIAVLRALGQQWLTDDDVSHGPFVPAVAAYILWQRRQEFSEVEWKPNYWGLAIVAWGIFQLLLGSLGVELFLQRTSIIITITGMVLTLGGTQVLKLAGFPIFLLVFMVPLPKVIYGQITLPLQLFASRCAETALSLLGIPVLREGNIIELPSGPLNVVEACSGIRSLMALSFLGLVFGYFFDDRPWMKWALLAATVPIAIAANAFRVSFTGLLTEYDRELAQGFFHMLEGWVIFVFAGLMLLATHRIISFIVKRVDKSKQAAAAA